MSLFDLFRQAVQNAPVPVQEWLPKPFNPTFDQDVWIIYNGQKISRVNPVYCATFETTLRLTEILKDLQPVIERKTLDWNNLSPIYCPVVFWIKFAGGQACNAGLLANYWVVNRSFSVAEAAARQDIALTQPERS